MARKQGNKNYRATKAAIKTFGPLFFLEMQMYQTRQVTRQATNRVLELVEDGLLDRDTVIMACLKYMSEDDVADMARLNEFFYDGEDYDDEEE